MNPADIIYLTLLTGSSAYVGISYAFFFDDISETTMVNMSYLWFFCFVTGIVGMLTRTKKYRHVVAIASGVSVLSSLYLFFELIWPSL